MKSKASLKPTQADIIALYGDIETRINNIEVFIENDTLAYCDDNKPLYIDDSKTNTEITISMRRQSK